MAQATDTVWLPVLPSMKGFSSALVKGGSTQAAVGGKTLGATMGKAMVVGIAAAAAGVAAVGTVLYQTGKTFDDVNNTIRVGTGATGDALEGLNDVAKSVGQNVPAEWDKIATTVADLNTRLGLSGDTLDKVASQYLEAGRILGEDVDIEKTSAAFNAFGVEGEEVSGAMDHLFRVSQATGVGMNELAEKARGAAPAAQALGLSFDETTGMVGSLEKAGLNSSGMMQQMSRRLGDLAEAGEEPRDTFDRVTGEIENLMEQGDTFGAQELAGQAFGTRNAEQFMKALEDGTLNMDELANVAGMTEDSILEAGRETMQFGEQWQLFKNNVMVWLEPLATRVFGAINDLLETAVQGVKDFGAAFEGGDVEGKMGRLGAKAREVFDYMENTAIPAVKDFGSYVTDTVIPALRDFGTWLNNNKTTIGVVATVITAILLPALARMGIAALVNGAKAVAGWVMQQAAAVRAGIVYVVQSIRIIATWAAMAAAAVASGARMALVWAVQVIRAAASGAASFVRSAARVVGGWVLMSLQSLLHAGRMAAAWFIALGPIGWVTAAVIAIAALVIANWDKIVYWTKKIWSAIVDWIVGAWHSIRERTTALLTAIVNWITLRFQIMEAFVRKLWRDIRELIVAAWEGIRDRTREILAGIVTWITDRFTAIRDTTTRIWNSVRDKISDVWNGIKNTLKSVWENGIKPVFNAFGNFIKDTVVSRIETGIDMIKSAWEKVANIFRKPINWVINTVWNGGIKKAFDAVSKAVGSDTRLAEVKEIGAFAKGGLAPKGWALVGEEGPELVNFKNPGRVYTADQTRTAMSGDVKEGEHVHPMGGNWVSKAWDSVKDAASSALSWVRGGLASAAESLLKPLISSATGQMAKFGSMGALGGGLIDNGVDRLLEWIRGEDTVESSGGHEYDGPMQMGGAYRPGRGPITSWYGMRGGRLHGGVDIAGPRGAPTFAAWDGVVHSIQNYAQGSGLSVNLSHGGGKYSHYGHNDYGGIPVRAGQSVKAGQRIGNMGMTGRTTGPHVHFETWQGGLWNRRNPNHLFRDKGGLLPPGVSSVLNNTGGNEYISNQRQFDNLNRMAELAVSGRGGYGEVQYHVHSAGSQYQDANDFRRTMRRLERVGH